MTTELIIGDRKIPVRFISSDQKAIPRLLTVLESSQLKQSVPSCPPIQEIDHIEVIGNNAVLYDSKARSSVQLPLY
ncbi:hypothetical protein [Paenibacillus mucilaginosus]|uniref:Uncharacterized protein n=2 Tax=Paenibacillus mucilaginosus TaxID=61624 RepID=I0BPX5_9BACL|nr:hypothetical protein [Paenibacillus mucilaginosus]AEI42511.1 hypothetical protein KNP414_03973 [Paenibacillus mucilaginosus KNP414]AFH64422.1 hypothetical protein B2K_27640 [Paenibacillus mucilaginosus K02]MCG7213904.1 hypothetical protein [Paenibacillus mucilaginosus]WDM25910.1 hypothetical protein KCX80_26180 [Paenibacillus mucilaginosus]